MTIVSTVFISILAVCAVIGTLLGMLRGLNRAALRLGLVVLSLVISFLVYMPITRALFDFNFGGFTINGYITELFADAGAVPESLLSLVFSLVEILTGIIVFVLVFLALEFVTWLVAFPILKIFVRCEKKKNILFGALIGLVQGILVAVIICAPISGILVESEKIADIEIDGNTLVDLPEEMNIKAYTDSSVAKLLDTTGGWVFDIVSTTTDNMGRKVSISSVCNTATTLVSVTNEITNAYSNLDNISSEGETTVETMKNVGDAFIKVGTAIEELDEDSKVLVNDLMSDVKDMAASALGELPPELETVIDNIDVEEIKIKSAGDALNAMAKYVEDGYANDGTAPNLTQKDVDDIVNGIADNMFVLDMLGTNGMTLIEVDGLNADSFKSAIGNTTLSQEEKDTLFALFGLN